MRGTLWRGLSADAIHSGLPSQLLPAFPREGTAVEVFCSNDLRLLKNAAAVTENDRIVSPAQRGITRWLLIYRQLERCHGRGFARVSRQDYTSRHSPAALQNGVEIVANGEHMSETR